MATLLELVQGAAAELRMTIPGLVMSSEDPDGQQWRELAKIEGEELARRHWWEGLMQEATHTTLAAEDQGAITTIASQGFEAIKPGTVFDRTQQMEILGPVSARDWQTQKGTVSLSPYYKWRIRGGRLLTYPAPAAGQTLAFEYRSKYYCESAGGTGQAAWLADDDVSRLPAHIFRLGLIWRWRSANKLNYAQEHATYEAAISEAITNDGGTTMLSLSGRGMGVRQSNLPEGNWPL